MVTRQRILPLGVVALLLTACSSTKGDWNSLRSLRARQAVEQKSAEMSRFLGNIQRIELEIVEAQARKRELDLELTTLLGITRSKSLELGQRLATLRALEDDLKVAAARKQEIEAEMGEIRALEARYAERAKVAGDLSSKIAALEQSVVPLQAAAKSKQVEIAATTEELRGKLSKLDEISAQLQAALSAAGAAVPAAPEPVPAKQDDKQASGKQASGKQD